MVWYRVVVKLLEIAYYEGDQTTAKTLAAEGTNLINSKVGEFPSLFQVCEILSNLVNRKTRKTRNLTIYAYSTESPCTFGNFSIHTNLPLLLGKY